SRRTLALSADNARPEIRGLARRAPLLGTHSSQRVSIWGVRMFVGYHTNGRGNAELAPGYFTACNRCRRFASRTISSTTARGMSGSPPIVQHRCAPSRPLQPIRKDLVIRFRRQRLAREAIMAAKEISVKKYVVRLSGEERERLET